MADEAQQTEGSSKAAPHSGGKAAISVGLIAAASALAGGLAVAWWHRKTLQQIIDTPQHHHTHEDEDFGI